MEKTQAEHISKRWQMSLRGLSEWPWDVPRNQAVADAATASISDTLEWLVPERVLAAASVSRVVDGPVVYVLVDGALYVVSCLGFNGMRGVVRARRLPLDPAQDSLSVDVSMFDSPTGLRADIEWRFRLHGYGDIDIIEVLANGQAPGDEHRLALALAAQLGWEVPDPVAGPRLQVRAAG